MVFTTLIPTRLNDGAKVSDVELDAIVNSFWQKFGGVTVEGRVNGHWIDTDDGKHYEDVNIKVVCVCDRNQLADAEAFVISIGRKLGQLAMYFEVRDYDGVQFLTVA